MKYHTSTSDVEFASTVAHLESAREQINTLLEEKQALETELRAMNQQTHQPEESPIHSKDDKVKIQALHCNIKL